MAPDAPSNGLVSEVTTKKMEKTVKIVKSGKDEKLHKTGRWDASEHKLFLQGLQQHGKNWKKIAELVKTRSSVQTRTHAQKYFLKTAKKNEENSKPANKDIKTEQKTKHALPSCDNRPSKKLKEETSLEKLIHLDELEQIYQPVVDDLYITDVVSTPRITNSFARDPPSVGGNIRKHLQATTRSKPSYKRSLDLDADSFFGTFLSNTKTLQTDFKISAPFDLESFDEDSLASSTDHMSCDDDLLLSDGLDLIFADQFC